MKTSGTKTPADLHRTALELAGAEPVRVTIQGGSMQPVYRSGDAVFVDPSGRSQPAAGQVITFMQEDGLMTHRVVRVETAQVLTKGDAVRSFDPPIPRGQILGTVIAHERDGRLRPVSTGLRDRLVAGLSRLEGNVQGILSQKGWRRYRLLRGMAHIFFRTLISAAAGIFPAHFE